MASSWRFCVRARAVLSEARTSAGRWRHSFAAASLPSASPQRSKPSHRHTTDTVSLCPQSIPDALRLQSIPNTVRWNSDNSSGDTCHLDILTFHRQADETLEELSEFFDQLAEEDGCHDDYDVYLSDGVLTVNIGGDQGIYVINKQTPNQQIWLSSPFSGPKRYDMIGGRWIYTHDGVAMHDLLSLEFSDVMQKQINFNLLPHSHIENIE